MSGAFKEVTEACCDKWHKYMIWEPKAPDEARRQELLAHSCPSLITLCLHLKKKFYLASFLKQNTRNLPEPRVEQHVLFSVVQCSALVIIHGFQCSESPQKTKEGGNGP